jgi:hypothetical protein
MVKERMMVEPQETQTVVQAQPGAVVNLTKLAEKIGVLAQGTVVRFNI